MNRAREVEENLVAAGLSASEALAKARLFEKAALALGAMADRAAVPAHSFFVPGRVEVLGKHTDYAGGRSLLCAAERGFCMIAAPRLDFLVRVVDALDGSREDFAIDSQLPAGSGWTLFPRTVARRIARDFPGGLRGADIAFASDLPRAADLSSSSALVVGLFTALADSNELRSRAEFTSNIRTDEQLAEYLTCLESGSSFGGLSGDCGVGVLIGSEDHTAILCGRRGELAQYAFRPVRRERIVPFPPEWTFVVASSGVASDKTGSAREKYNRLSRAARVALDLWNKASGREDATLLSAATSTSGAPERIREILRESSPADFPAQMLLDRFDQFLQESIEIIPAAADAFARRDGCALGDLVDRSQSAAERLLGNQIPETIGLARLAEARGAIAASAFGGGFGGSVWALVLKDEAGAFRSRWAQDYARTFPASACDADFFETRPGPALLRLDP